MPASHTPGWSTDHKTTEESDNADDGAILTKTETVTETKGQKQKTKQKQNKTIKKTQPKKSSASSHLFRISGAGTGELGVSACADLEVHGGLLNLRLASH